MNETHKKCDLIPYSAVPIVNYNMQGNYDSLKNNKMKFHDFSITFVFNFYDLFTFGNFDSQWQQFCPTILSVFSRAVG